MSTEVRVGILFFLGLGLLLWFTFFVTGLGSSAGDFAIRFPEVNQLKNGDGVTYNGVRVGKVATVQPVQDEGGKAAVEVTFSIDEGVRGHVLLGPQTRVRIRQGVLGGAELAITSTGGAAISRETLRALRGESSTGIPETVELAQQILAENRRSIQEMVSAFRDAGKNVSDLAADARSLVNDNREQVAAMLKNIGEMSERVAKLVEENRATVAAALVGMRDASRQIADAVQENRDHLKQVMAELPKTAEGITKAAKQMEEMLSENRASVKDALAKLAEFAPRLDRIGKNLEVITQQIAEGKGTVGKLVFEDTLHEKATTAADSLTQRLEEVKPLTQGISDLKVYAGVYGGMNPELDTTTGHAYLRLEPRPWKFYQAGVSYRWVEDDRNFDEDPEELGLTFDLVLGWRFFPDDRNQTYRLSIAGGLVESRLGGMVIVPITDDTLRFVGMIRNKDKDFPENRRRHEDGSVMARATVEWQPLRRYGVRLIAGGDDLIDDAAPWVGIRAELLDTDLRNLTGLSGFAR